MLRIGLTGGIGSGKSTVSARLAELGAEIIDADVIAREVVQPGEPALAAIAEHFGSELVSEDGSLRRAELGRRVFGDPAALRALEAITHPAIWARTAQRFAAMSADAIVVHDMPLLVEKAMSSEYHLTVVVGASERTRRARLISLRGMDPADAAARIQAQADDAVRRAAADVWLDNEGTPDELMAQVDRLWQERLVPFERNLRLGIRQRRPNEVTLVLNPAWESTGARLAARISAALGPRAIRVDHIGSTAVPDLLAKEVIDLQVGVRHLGNADDPDFRLAMGQAGYVLMEGTLADRAKDGSVWAKRFYGGCDPGQIVHVHVREVGSPGWLWALRFRDWLRADDEARAEYAAMKTMVAQQLSGWDDYPERKEPWFDGIHERVLEWAGRTGWQPQ